jgi:hypothetical protein
MKQIIFIFSLPRSGSTLLQRMLAAHPQISTHAEPWLLLPLAYSIRGAGVYAEYHHGNAARAITALADSLPHQTDDYYHELGQMVRLLYTKLARDESVYFLDKTPRYYLILPEIRKMFPEAKFIFLFRNPLQIYASMLETWYGGRLLMHGSHMDLFRGTKLLAAGFRDMGGSSARVNFEDLVNGPEATIRKVLTYLDLDYNPACVEDFNQVRFDGDFGDQAGSQRYADIRHTPLEKWKEAIDTVIKKKYAKQFLSFIGPHDLDTLGYPLESLRQSLKGLRVKKFGVIDLMAVALGSFIRVAEPVLFMEKYRQKRQDGFPFTLHR